MANRGIDGLAALRRTLLTTIVPAALLVPATLKAQDAGPQASSQDEPASSADGEIIVTASRRSETASKLPFNISAYDPEQLSRSNITDVTALSNQVPNFVVQDQGARAEGQSVPIIRGLNASGLSGVSAPRYFQPPVGIYQDNVPLISSFPLMDLERVEVLRGPQGTLYGAGTLSGAVRLITKAPQLGELSGYGTAGISDVSHSDDISYEFEGALNFPLGDTFAVRLSARHQYEAGFIDLKGIFRREGDDYTSGAPVLANPNDVGGSSGVYFDKNDYNFTRSTGLRAAALWQPTDKFEARLTYSYARLRGDGGPYDNGGFSGGPSPIDPRITLEPTGAWERSGPTLEPYERDTHLAAIDASYELGFATLATTIAFNKTDGKSNADQTVALLGSPYGVYYTGIPANPRSVIPVLNSDSQRSNTQEIRLVSNPGKPIDFVIGAYFQQQRRSLGLQVYAPGADVQSAAANGGSTLPLALGGTYVPLFANGLAYDQQTQQRFREYSGFADITWHVTDAWSVTGGARVFRQEFEQQLRSRGSLFFLEVDAANERKITDVTFKANTSYQLGSFGQVYATFSQGFRRGGANAFQLDGPVQEPPELLNYDPDRTNNFEVGVKGRVGGIRFSADVFYIDWTKPQIDTTTPYTLTNVVINGAKAESKGFELEASGNLGLEGLTFSGGFAYARARLSESFSLPAGSGVGSIIPDAISGSKGDRLPGAPDYSGSLTITYEKTIGDGTATFSVGGDYRSSTVNDLPQPAFTEPFIVSPGYVLFRTNLSYRTGAWEFLAFADNLFNRRVQLSAVSQTPYSASLLGDFGNAAIVNKPREIGLKVTRTF